MKWLKIVTGWVLVVAFAIAVGLGAATVVHLVRRGGANATALRAADATLAKVVNELPGLDSQLAKLAHEKHPNPVDIRKLRREIR